MRNLIDKIQNLDGKSVNLYSKLFGRYEQDGIIYDIRNVYGGQFKYATVAIEISSVKLFGYNSFRDSDKIAISSHIMREFGVAAHIANDEMQQSDANVQKGFFLVYKFGNRVLNNSVVKLDRDTVTVTLTVKLPYNTSSYNGSFLDMSKKAQENARAGQKKGIISSQALKILLAKNMPMLIKRFVADFSPESLYRSVSLWRNQEYIRYYLKQNGYVAFIADGSVLPRKGKTDYKDARGAVPFESPEESRITIELPEGDKLCGMAIRRGITLITGDAYHGKSTILEAVREGVYNHVSGDGREYVITDSSAMNIRSEDGRSIKNSDISFFLRRLPVKAIIPQRFSTDNASGSTSQAAAVAEAVESSCKLMLFDEDRSANNFMYKDSKMRSVIKNESTCPYIDNARMFLDKYDISSIIVVGASGEYFSIADKVILVENFKVSEYIDYKREEKCGYVFSPRRRVVDLKAIGKSCLTRNIEIKDDTTIKIGSEIIDVSEIIPQITRGQLDFVSSFIYYLTVFEQTDGATLKDAVMKLYRKIAENGISSIHQIGLRGTNNIIEFVRPEDMMMIFYRLKSIGFIVK